MMDFDVSLTGLPISLLKIKFARNADRTMSADCLAAKLSLRLKKVVSRFSRSPSAKSPAMAVSVWDPHP